MKRIDLIHRLHGYFTAVDRYKENPEEAFEKGKARAIETLQHEIEQIKKITLQDYCNATGSKINED